MYVHIRIMQNVMNLSEVLKEMKKLDENKNPIPFSISVRTFERENLYGGRLLNYKNVTLLQAPKNKGKNRLADQTAFKNPYHFANRTRNIKNDSGIYKINILFITKFNGKQVVY
jgi:hypothetical protein